MVNLDNQLKWALFGQKYNIFFTNNKDEQLEVNSNKTNNKWAGICNHKGSNGDR